MKQQRRNCELCESEATVFCPSDSAFLCFTCDSKVHEANFLVARHIRQAICQTCNKITETGVSGVSFRPFTAACRNCTDDDEDIDDIHSASSDCVSTTTTTSKSKSKSKRSSAAREVRNNSARVHRSQRVNFGCVEAEGIFVNWGRRLGVGSGDVAVQTACSGLRVCLERWKSVLPFRVCLAASMWLGLRIGGLDKSAVKMKLKQLEEISGVPARVIVAAESKLDRVLRSGRVQQRNRVEMEEGWAEC